MLLFYQVLDEHLPKALKNFGVVACTMKMPKEGEEDDKESVHQAYDARLVWLGSCIFCMELNDRKINRPADRQTNQARQTDRVMD